ncbi:cytochrome P450 [Lentinula raphanica]|nr:cytochrome P450 [Lentinula raphanica]
MGFSLFVIVDLCFVVASLAILRRIFNSSKPPPLSLPPGPKGLPLVGNILDMPTEKEWETFAQWGDAFGDICSVTVLGQPLIILNSTKVAVDLLDKRSSIYSDRPVLQMGGELCGWKNTLVLLPYGDRFKRFRKLFHNLIGSQAIMRQYFPAQELESKKFLRKVLAEPDDLQAHVRRLAGSVILRISHGYEVQEHKDDPFVTLANAATEQFSLATSTGQFLVDCIPALKHVPDWMPGADFKRQAKQWAATLVEMVEQPHNFVKQQINAGTAKISFTASMLESKPLTEEEEFDLKWSAASLYSGAADTTVSAIYAFFLAMTLYPEVARKAQAEIDAVVGNDRLPTFADRQHLPYVDALVKEVFRWNVVAPLAVPHRAAQDDVYDGYLIPKGSLLIPNLWKLMHDPRVYHNPFEFKPERYLADALAAEGLGRQVEPHPRESCFGFGRRICPGMHFADTTVFASCVTSLAVLDISKCVERGVVVEPVNDRTSGTISHPKAFKCNIKPRSPKAVALIQSSDEYF